MGQPILACCNFSPEAGQLRDFAMTYGFGGVDWTFSLENLPTTPAVRHLMGLGNHGNIWCRPQYGEWSGRWGSWKD